ncbi:hypothetical protein LGM80_25400 [Burkholderia multivorans]|jgi:hypothetical protein|uniref:hypothetical protein n=1 Tax=Burkholderia multivorans TaxID=87883 RepID=UPI0015E3241B|nr:hypothetical protein [Burkholderia multivorans]MCA8376701.1 hypothetical protein [Burkholderia multivorans]
MAPILPERARLLAARCACVQTKKYPPGDGLETVASHEVAMSIDRVADTVQTIDTRS